MNGTEGWLTETSRSKTGQATGLPSGKRIRSGLNRGVDVVFPIIVPPQVAMVGFGRISERPVVVDGTVVAHTGVDASLTADHRVTDGHRGGLFLLAVDRLLQEPEDL